MTTMSKLLERDGRALSCKERSQLRDQIAMHVLGHPSPTNWRAGRITTPTRRCA